MHCVIETEAFASSAKALGMSEEERHRITVRIAEDPAAGDLILGTGGARKLRFPFGGKGKSGGIRVITYYAAADVPVFLLEVFAKGERINLSKAERNELRNNLASIADDYRTQVRDRVAKLGEAG